MEPARKQFQQAPKEAGDRHDSIFGDDRHRRHPCALSSMEITDWRMGRSVKGPPDQTFNHIRHGSTACALPGREIHRLCGGRGWEAECLDQTDAVSYTHLRAHETGRNL